MLGVRVHWSDGFVYNSRTGLLGVRVHWSDGVVYNSRTGLLGVRVHWSDGVVYNSTTGLLSAMSAKGDVWKSTMGLLRTYRSG